MGLAGRYVPSGAFAEAPGNVVPSYEQQKFGVTSFENRSTS